MRSAEIPAPPPTWPIGGAGPDPWVFETSVLRIVNSGPSASIPVPQLSEMTQRSIVPPPRAATTTPPLAPLWTTVVSTRSIAPVAWIASPPSEPPPLPPGNSSILVSSTWTSPSPTMPAAFPVSVDRATWAEPWTVAAPPNRLEIEESDRKRSPATS